MAIKKGFRIGGNAGVVDLLPGTKPIAVNDAQGSTASSTMIKVREAKMNVKGTVTVTFQLTNTEQGSAVQGRIYKNDIAFSPTYTTTTNAGTETFTVDVPVVAGDLIQLYVNRWTNSSGVTFQFFRIMSNVAQAEITL